MCGFAGVVSFEASRQIGPELRDQLVAVALRGLQHRGPDGRGTWWNGSDTTTPTPDRPQALFVHTRLAVLDLDPRSDQPFVSRDGSTTTAFNGEIYNFRDLRERLPEACRTDGDTEVLTELVAGEGEAATDQLLGMFAFAAVRQQGEVTQLVLARDAAGEKPLYYAVEVDPRRPTRVRAVAFASELRVLRQMAARLGWFELATDENALAAYLAWGYVPAPATIHVGLRELLPGHTLTIDAAGSRLRRYFDAGAPFERVGAGRWASTLTLARDRIEAAVARQTVADVPIGCLLSGGIDSSVVALHLRRQLGPGVRTFGVGFDGAGAAAFDESQYAADVARHLGCEHTELRLSDDAQSLESEVASLARLFGQPFADSSAIPTRRLAKLVREHVKVALGGDGGDEVFGGYDRYRAMLLAAKLRRRLGPLGSRNAASLAGWLRGGPKSRVRQLRRLLVSLPLSPAARYASYLRIFDEAELRSVLAAGRPPADDESERIAGRWFDAFTVARPGQLASTAAAVDRVTYLPGDLLRKVDRCSMAHSLEVRSPFLDRDLLRLAGSLNDGDLIRDGRGKAVLRDAYAADLPEHVFKRRKQGFAVPLAAWLRGPLRTMTRDRLTSSDSIVHEHLSPRAVVELLDEHESGRSDHAAKLYALLMLDLWHQDAQADRM
jgi:asparagine synthase (glutamine-hydrolysing)